MLTTPLLSPLGKLRWLAERFVPAHRGQEDMSVGEFVRTRMGNEVLDRIVAPLVAGIYTADVNRLSMKATMANILEMQQKHGSLAKATAARRRRGEDSIERQSTGARYSQFRAFKGGMSDLIRSLADALPPGTIRTNCPVESLRSDGELLVSGSAETEKFDHVVVTTPARVSANLLHEIAPDASAELASIESASTAIVVLVVPRSNITKPVGAFGFVVPLCERRSILACSFASEKFAGRAPEDHVIIRIFIGGTMQRDLLQLDDDRLQEIAMVGLKGEPVLVRIRRWNNAMPQYNVGHLERVKRIEMAIKPLPSLSLVSNSLHGVGIAPVIASAEKMAKVIVDA
jgi:oxygen-dependent protoporphyrinogen oxidase